jgi:hypothetical protein
MVNCKHLLTKLKPLQSPLQGVAPFSAVPPERRSPLARLGPLGRYRLEQATIAGAAALVGIVIGVVGALALSDDDQAPPPAPEIAVSQPEVGDVDIPETAEQLGFPGFATRNTTRIAGRDPVVDAAGAALAAFPAGAGVAGPDAVSVVGDEDWAGALAAASLVAEPVGAPILIGEPGSVPEFTEDAAAALDPGGSRSTGRAQAFAVGDVEVPDGLEAELIAGADPAEIAVAIAKLRRKLTGPPAHYLVVSADDPAYAMPAAAWSARSGDPILFTRRNEVPGPTLRELMRNRDVPVYVLGPEEAIRRNAFAQIEAAGGRVDRVAGADPVANAIAFARFADGSFGWDINDPGHGMAIANVDRPLDVAAAASVASRGKPGPLLLTDDPVAVPPLLRAFLLDTKPGYYDDPARAVYNHIWLIGDTTAMGIGFQVQVDELANLERVRAGAGG